MLTSESPLSQAAGTNPPLHPSGHLTPAKPQHHAGNAASSAKENKYPSLAQHPLGLPPPGPPPFRLTLRRHHREHFFLTKKFIARMQREPPGSRGCSAAQPALQALTDSSIWVTVSNISDKKHQNVKQWREPQFIYGAAHRHLQFIWCAWTEPRPSALKSSPAGNWHLQFFTAAKGIVYYICSALGYNKKEKVRQKILQTRLSLGILTTQGKLFFCFQPCPRSETSSTPLFQQVHFQLKIQLEMFCLLLSQIVNETGLTYNDNSIILHCTSIQCYTQRYAK